MKELLLFRIFALFPFIGIAVPDLANALHTSFSSIPKEHIIVDTTLGICLIVCSLGMWVVETLAFKASAGSSQMSSLLTQEA